MAELIWDGNTTSMGGSVLRFALNFLFKPSNRQRECAGAAAHAGTLLSGNDPEWRTASSGATKVRPASLSRVRRKVDLIYIDPPFDTGADFSYNAAVPGDDYAEDGMRN